MRLYRPVQPPTLQRANVQNEYRYREYMPNKSLANYIACYWVSEYNGEGIAHASRVIPDGCVDIIFNLRATSVKKGAFLTGLMRTYEDMLVTEPQSLIGIRFYAEGAARFLHYPVAMINGHHPNLEDIWGKEADEVIEGLLEASDTAERIVLLERELIKRMWMDDPADPLLLTSMNYLYEYRGNLSMGALAEKVNYSERTLRRTFQQQLGMSPKELGRIIQFQGLLQMLAKGTRTSFTDAALQCGYYDQSHLIKSFHTFYGVAPSKIVSPDRVNR
ncbi:helix-turn-helix domain-containing protein [Brevibacillus sp. M2.1A]|uniref:AraC family transcriptional regulator n=1 Tax=Brevibacillus TaxID=55080 RepID=UPI001E2ABF7C|nr:MULTISPECIES: helix-turn-helix domain-containing protein [Brevibacillus]MCC8434972.1 helix-turn-helix domain-containing protein [Brevibacillus sp. M2.1A]